MAKETERRFLLVKGFNPEPFSESWLEIQQSYLAGTGDWIIRVRETFDGVSRYNLTLKRPETGMTADEHEPDISREAYEDIRKSCGPEVVKTRYVIPYAGRDWEVDVYHHEGLDPSMIAEVELPSEDIELHLPEWVGEEVTGNQWYSNHAISQRVDGLPVRRT